MIVWRLLLLVTLTVWLNQSVSVNRYGELRDRIERGEASWTLTVQQPFLFAYRRAYDEELYCALSGAMLGRPIDHERLRSVRAHSNAHFERAPPPADGRWHAPYREIALEYPPLVIPWLLLPRLWFDDFTGYARAFSASMGIVLWLAVELVASLWRSPQMKRRVFVCAWLSVLAHGSIAVQRLDALVAFTLALALWAWQRKRPGLLGIALGLGAALKLLPALWLLPVLAFDPTLRARRVLLGFACALGLGLLPLAWWDPAGTMFAYHAGRGLHAESVAASVLAALVYPFAPVARAVATFGAYHVQDTRADAIAMVLPVVLMAVLLAWCLWGRRRRARGVQGRAAVLTVSVGIVLVCGKVLSPQYLTWIVPLVGALPHRGALRRCSALWWIAALILSQVYLRAYFDAVYMMRPLGIATLLARDVCVLLAMVCCARADCVRTRRLVR